MNAKITRNPHNQLNTFERDNTLWKKDGRVLKEKHEVGNDQFNVNYIIRSFQHRENKLTADLHLTVGKHRL